MFIVRSVSEAREESSDACLPSLPFALVDQLALFQPVEHKRCDVVAGIVDHRRVAVALDAARGQIDRLFLYDDIYRRAIRHWLADGANHLHTRQSAR
jgi:hypothetical protein